MLPAMRYPKLPSLRLHTILVITLIGMLMSACNLEQEVDLNLPEHEEKLVVECFLEPGLPYRLSLFESRPYFGEIDFTDVPIITDALVIIRYNGVDDTLTFTPIFSPEGKIYTYTSPTLVPFDYQSEFELYILDQQGREVTGRTTILPPVPIDSISYELNEDSAARVITRFMDPAGEDNLYRYSLHENTLDSAGYEFDFELTDEFSQGEEIVLSTFFFREIGDSAIVTIYHIDQAYLDWLITTDAARDANGNPFGQPASVTSNIVGGIGIFTGLSYDRKGILIE